VHYYHAYRDEESDLNPMQWVWASPFRMLPVIYTCIATVAVFLLSQGHFLVAAGGLRHP
jgi:hypothetical protein